MTTRTPNTRNNIFKLGSLLLVLAFAFFLVSHVNAQVSAGGVNISVPGVSVQASNSGGANVSVGGINIKANSNGANIQMGGMGTINATKAGAQVNVQEGGNSVNVTASGNGATIDVSGPPVSVTTDAQLSTYVSTMKAKDAAITDVSTSPTKITVSYNQPASFFGVIPTTLPAQVVVDASGNVSVQLPWYSFLTTNNSASVSAAIKQDQNVAASNGSLSDSAQAWVVYDTSNSVAAQ